jgi:hypothetical protein
MSNIHHLNLAHVRAPLPAWHGDPLDHRPIFLQRTEVFQIGDRVIVPPTPGAIDPACRDGGPGEVVGVREDTASGKPFAYVQVDDSTDVAQPYAFFELRREPTV